jgi:hypothetical protein
VVAADRLVEQAADVPRAGPALRGEGGAHARQVRAVHRHEPLLPDVDPTLLWIFRHQFAQEQPVPQVKRDVVVPPGFRHTQPTVHTGFESVVDPAG